MNQESDIHIMKRQISAFNNRKRLDRRQNRDSDLAMALIKVEIVHQIKERAQLKPAFFLH